jgi:hypothetical protein
MMMDFIGFCRSAPKPLESISLIEDASALAAGRSASTGLAASLRSRASVAKWP